MRRCTDDGLPVADDRLSVVAEGEVLRVQAVFARARGERVPDLRTSTIHQHTVVRIAGWEYEVRTLMYSSFPPVINLKRVWSASVRGVTVEESPMPLCARQAAVQSKEREKR